MGSIETELKLLALALPTAGHLAIEDDWADETTLPRDFQLPIPEEADFGTLAALEDSGVYPAGIPWDPMPTDAVPPSFVSPDGEETWLTQCRQIERAALAVTKSPDRASLHCDLAQARLAFGAPRGAADDCTRALERKPDESRAYLLRALARRQLGELTGARRDCEIVLKLTPNCPQALLCRAQVGMAEGCWEEALEDFDFALALPLPRRPDIPALRGQGLGEAFKHRAICKRHLGDIRGAKDDLRAAIALAPHDGQARRMLANVSGS